MMMLQIVKSNWLAIALATVYLIGLQTGYLDLRERGVIASGKTALQLILKTLPIYALLASVLRNSSAASTDENRSLTGNYCRSLSIGFILCAIGDVFLELSQACDRYFVFGLGAFLLGHVLYIHAFSLRAPNSANSLALSNVAARCVPFFAIGLALFALMRDGLPSGLTVPVLVYSMVIATMASAAALRIGRADSGSFSQRAALAGAAVFMLSDVMIGVNKFYAPFEHARFLIMVTYYLGQLGIASSSLDPLHAIKKTD
jgi:alkenylglycerophosphocholine hydrolase